MWMNEYDMHDAASQSAGYPVLNKAVRFLIEFKDEVNANSDGWPYWNPPAKAATKLMDLIQAARHARKDITEADFKRALTPIKTFYAKRGYAAKMKYPEGF